MDKVTFLGHATILIEINGLRILTDPFIRNSVAHLKREAPPVEDRLLKDIDLVLLSHHHQDHLDFKSLKNINPPLIVGCPDTKGVLRKRKLEGVDLVAGEVFNFKGVEIKAIKANHPHSKTLPFKRVTGDPVGFIVEGRKKVYFAGDTDLFPEMADLLKEAIDLAALPIWGWGPNLGPGHLDPKKAALVTELIKPKVAIPIHWGTYFPRLLKNGRDTLTNKGPEFKEEVIKTGSETEVFVLKPGQEIII
jgi:L-ascorbate metabolism protein UlaG (beta-lactamase superfamily)